VLRCVFRCSWSAECTFTAAERPSSAPTCMNDSVGVQQSYTYDALRAAAHTQPLLESPAVCTNEPQGTVSGTFINNTCDNPTYLGQTCARSYVEGFTGSLIATCIGPDTWTTNDTCAPIGKPCCQVPSRDIVVSKGTSLCPSASPSALFLQTSAR